MTFDELVGWTGHLSWFDLATLAQLSGERRESITNHMYRLAKAGRVVALRRGLYTLGEQYRKAPLQTAALANALYRPSYLSCEWALSYHGLVPEKAAVQTSVTSRVPRRFTNAFGEFTYRNIKQELFGGYEVVRMSGAPVLLASPEKALFDFLHLSTGEWTAERVREMRFSAGNAIDLVQLERLARLHGSPRVQRAVSGFTGHLSAADDGGVGL